MSPGEIVFDVAGEEFTNKNRLEAVVGAIATVGALGATGPITVPLTLAGGALAGAGGEAAVKNAVRGIGSIVVNVAKGADIGT